MDELRRLVENGTLEEAIQRFETLKEGNQLTPAELGKAYRIIGVAHRKLGDSYAARDHAAEAERLAEEAGDLETVLMSWSNLLDYCNEIGDTHLAIEYGQKWLSEVSEWCPDMVWRSGRILYNLSRAYRQRKENMMVIDHLERALGFLRSDPVPEYLVMCLQNLAWVLYEAHLLDRGDTLVTEARELLSRCEDAEGLRELHLLTGYRAYMAGEYSKATEIAKSFLEDEGATILQRFWAMYIVGGSALALAGDSPSMKDELLESASSCADVCIDLGTKLRRADLMNIGGALRRRAFHGRNEQAG